MKKRINVETVIEIIDHDIELYRDAMDTSRKSLCEKMQEHNDLAVRLHARSIDTLSYQIIALEQLRSAFT